VGHPRAEVEEKGESGDSKKNESWKIILALKC